jgi:hypothetical protein
MDVVCEYPFYAASFWGDLERVSNLDCTAGNNGKQYNFVCYNETVVVSAVGGGATFFGVSES